MPATSLEPSLDAQTVVAPSLLHGQPALFAEALIPLFHAALQCGDSTLATAVARRFEERAPHMEGLYPHMFELYAKWHVLAGEPAAADRLTILELAGRKCEQDWVAQAAANWRDLARQLRASGS